MELQTIQQLIRDNLYGKTRINSNISNISWWEKRNLTYLRDKIIEMTNFLPIDAQWVRRIWHIENNILEPMICGNPACNNEIKWGLQGYGKSCSVACTQKVPSVTENRVATNMEKFGVAYYAGSEIHVAQTKKTWEEKFGTHPMHHKEIRDKLKKTKLERHGSETYNNMEKTRATKLERYGDENFNGAKKG